MKKLLYILFFLCCSVHADTSAIINKAVLTGTITRTEARALYLMKSRRLNDGQQVELFQMPTVSLAHKQFVRDVLLMTVEQYNREWDRLVNAGLGTMVHQVYSKQEMLNRISLTTNGLGYIDSDNLIVHTGTNDIKVLKITE